MIKRMMKKIGKRMTGEKSKPEKGSEPEPAPRPARTSGQKKDAAPRAAKKTPAPGVKTWRPGASAGAAASLPADAAKKAAAPSVSEEKKTKPAGAPPSDREDAPPPRRRRRRGGRGRKRTAESEPKGSDTSSEKPAGRPPKKPDATPASKPSAAPWDPASFSVPPQEGKVRFHDFSLPDPILHAIADLAFNYCTPIQAEALPPALAGKDIAGRAQTGTGKTAAFLVAIFNHFVRKPYSGKRPPATPRALVIAPTRELVVQIERDAHDVGRHMEEHTLALFGGADFERQRKKIQTLNPELIVATPGRLLDFRSRHELHLGRTEILVIDEADRMLDMGFIPDVRRIVFSTPPKTKRQTLLFSATLSDDVMRLASSWMVKPVQIDIEPEQVAVDTVCQQVFLVTSREKFSLLYHILKNEKPERALLFVNRRITAERLTRALKQHGFECELISGALPQNRRSRTLEAFRDGTIPFLVATDVAGRGLHIEGVSHVINYNIPTDAEDYVHRIGRTGRAGASGTSITFACEEESFYIPAIEEYIGAELRCEQPAEDWLRIPDDVKRIEIPDDPEPRERRGGPRGKPGGRPPRRHRG